MNHSRWNLMVLWLQSFKMTHLIDSVQTITGLHIFIMVFFSLFQGCNGSWSWQLLLRTPEVHPSRVLRGSGHQSPIPPFHLERVFSETLVRGHAHPHHHCRVSVFHLYGSGTLSQTLNTKAGPKPNSGTEKTVQLSFVHQKKKWEKKRWEFLRRFFGNSTTVNEVSVENSELTWRFGSLCWLLLICVCDYIFFEGSSIVQIMYGKTCGRTYDNPSQSLCSFLPKALQIMESVILFVSCNFRSWPLLHL